MTDEKAEKKTGLDLLREPFPENQIGKLPKPTKQQTDEVRANYKSGIRCGVCGQWHHPKVVHLDYVGHAPVTNRLLDVDLEWNWEPMSVNDKGLPTIVNDELWIKLTVCGVTRLGVGDAQGKTGTNATKEMIGDAIRNAGMRFGMALDLWHKGDLHVDDNGEKNTPAQPAAEPEPKQKWLGPLNKEDAKKSGQELAADLELISVKGDEAQLDARMKNAEKLMAQFHKDLPLWFDRIGQIVVTTREAIKAREPFPGDT